MIANSCIDLMLLLVGDWGKPELHLTFSEQPLAVITEAAGLKCFNLLQLRSAWLYLELSGNRASTDSPVLKGTAGALTFTPFIHTNYIHIAV